MKKVLFVTYHWPPAGGPGVQRVLKFAKYLPEFGWQPIILTVRHGEYPAIDETLSDEIPPSIKIYSTASLEPGNFYKRFTGMKPSETIPTAVLAEQNSDWRKRIAHWLRLNVFIPDAKIGWMPYALKTGKKIIIEERPDLIFSSSPPPTVHLIAQKLSQYSRLKWIADFRDPWTDIHYYENQKRIKFIEYLDRKIELNVLKKAHKITCISNYDIEMDFGRKIDKSKCINLANGYDEADFSKISTDFNFNGPFNILHLGAIGKERNPRNLFKAINKLDKEAVINPSSFRLTFVGKVETSVIDTIKYYDIFKYIHLVPYLPHKEALDFVKEASLMLLLITQSKKNIRILPGKTFEYLRSKRAIFALGPIDGEAARIINEAEVGVVLDYDNEQAIYTHLKNYYRSWHYGKKEGFIFDDVKVSNFSRQNLTKKLAEIFNNLIT